MQVFIHWSMKRFTAWCFTLFLSLLVTLACLLWCVCITPLFFYLRAISYLSHPDVTWRLIVLHFYDLTNSRVRIHGAVDNNKMKLIVIIWLAFIIVSSCLFDGTSGHGSHQHMGKHHDHYVPKVDRGAVHSVLDEKKLIQDTEWVVNLYLH